MFQKLARASVFAASLILVISRVAFSVHAPTTPVSQSGWNHGARAACIVGQLPARRS